MISINIYENKKGWKLLKKLQIFLYIYIERVRLATFRPSKPEKAPSMESDIPLAKRAYWQAKNTTLLNLRIGCALLKVGPKL